MLPRSADALAYSVTKEDDTADLLCDADCSLREAIVAANTSGGPDTIALPAGTYTLSIDGTLEDLGATGDLDITEDVTIIGAGAATTIIEACDSSGGPCVGIDRVMQVVSGTLTVEGVTIQNGKFTGSGGGGGIRVNSNAALMMTDSTVRNNTAAAGSAGGGIFGNSNTVLTLIDSIVSGNTANAAGGIYNEGMLTLTDSAVSDNHANEDGGGAAGGIFNPGTAILTNSTVSGNTGAFNGGGIVNFEVNSQLGMLTLTNSTISGNTNSGSGGGGIHVQSGTVTINNSTITGNSGLTAGGVANLGGTVSLKNTILGGNTGPGGPDCSGTLTSQGYNLIQSITDCIIGGDATGNVTGQGAGLAPLVLNAPGTTQTHALQEGSPAIDAGSPDCPPPATDQRGAARPQADACDIGAYESPFSAPIPTPSPTPSATPEATPTTSPSESLTATPIPTETSSTSPTETATASPTPAGFTWGDVDCSGAVDPVDSLKLLRFDAGLSLTQAQGCPPAGDPYQFNSSEELWGDVDCSDDISPIDSLKELRFDAGLSVAQTAGCPEIGTHV